MEKPLYERTCTNCGKAFISEKQFAKFCSQSCRCMDYNRRNKAKIRVHQERYRDKKRQKTYDRNLGESKCWDCKRSLCDIKDGSVCEWSMFLKPVPGWDAIEVAPGHYNVRECPKFVSD